MINVQNICDNEPCKWSLVRYLNLPDRNPGRIEKADKEFDIKLDFKDMKDPVKIKFIHKIKKRIPSTLLFLVMKIRKNIGFLDQKHVMKKTCGFIITGEEEKRHYVLIKDFNTSTYDHTFTWSKKFTSL